MSLSQYYQKIYNYLCGNSTNCRPWHFQWHSLRDLNHWQKERLWNLNGKILDVGCGEKPYELWLDPKKIEKYVGIDVISAKGLDYLVKPRDKWPLEDNSFDCVMMTQSLEHFEDELNTLNETLRVLKPNGKLLITIPFLLQQHGAPYDFRRYTIFGLKNLLEKNYNILEISPQGKVGAVLSMLFLTSIENTLNSRFIYRILKGILLPFWLLFSLIINIIGVFLNLTDLGLQHYCQVCIIATKKEINA